MGILSSIIGTVGNLLGIRSSAKSAQAQQQLSYEQNLGLMRYNYELADYYDNQYMSNSARATQTLNQNLMNYQYALERQSRQTSFYDTRQDLESAGYNPLLAVGQQSGYTAVGSGVSTQSDQVEKAGLATSAVQGLSQLSGAYDLNRQTTGNLQQIASDIVSSGYLNDLHGAQTDLTQSQNIQQILQNDITSAYGMQQALANLDLTKGQYKKAMQEIKESESNVLVNSARAQEIQSQTALNKQRHALMSSLESFNKKHPVVGGLIQSGALGNLSNLGIGLMHGLLTGGRFVR